MKKRIIGIALALLLIAISVPVAAAFAHETHTLDHIIITPDPATVARGGTQQFTAVGQDSDNITLPGVTYTWAVVAGGGTIDNTGLFTAGNVTGTFANTIKVTAEKNSIEMYSYATVTVKAAEDEEENEGKIPYGWSHGKKNGWHGENTPPGWSHGKKNGWQGEDKPHGLLKGKTDRDDD